MELDNGQFEGTATRRNVLKRGASGAVALALAGAVLAGGLPSPAGAAIGSQHAPTSDYVAASQGPRKSVMTTTTAVNFRDQPSWEGEVLMVLPAGTKVLVASEWTVNGFAKVTYKRITGWVQSAYLE